MIALPQHLAPWRAHLELFPPDLAPSVGALLPSLSLAIGPMRATHPAGGGDLDGFSGIARRGRYERLLISEWLLADEAPLEFLRRAASGEHVFHELTRRSPAEAATSVALFDAGPTALGAPRLAHLAALIVLAARAARARARFAWGLLHQPEGALFTEVSASAVTSLLRARTALGPSAGDVGAWMDRAARSGWEDAWIVGAQTIVPGAKHGTIAVRDVLDPDRRALAVTVRAPAAPPREIELDLPPPDEAARLLRDPFRVRRPQQQPRTAPEIASNLVFAQNGSKVFARARSGEIIAFPVPSSASAGVGKPGRYRARASGVVAAVGWVRRGLAMLTVQEGALVLEHAKQGGPPLLDRRIALDGGDQPALARVEGPLSPLIFQAHQGAEVFFTDARRALYHVGRDRLSDAGEHEDATGVAFVRRIAEDVAALAHSGGMVVYVGTALPVAEGVPASGRPELVIHGDRSGATPVALDDGGAAHFGLVDGRQGSISLVAVRRAGGTYGVFESGRAVIDHAVPEGARVVGPWRVAADFQPALLVIEPDGRSLSFVGARMRTARHQASAPIVEAVICPSRSVVAYTTREGEVALWMPVLPSKLASFKTSEIR